MSSRDWPANDYAIGSYVQATVADHYLSELKIKPTDRVLDIGCGDGSYTCKIIDRVPQGSVLGIDASASMLDLAKEISIKHPNFSVKKADVLDMGFESQFDYIVSFWCLQWINDIHKAFSNITKALRDNGQFFTLFPVGDDPFIMGYYAVRDSGEFNSLKEFKPPVDYSHLANLANRLESIPSQLNVTIRRESITLPSLDVFRKFVNGIAFYQGQISESEINDINEAMVRYYDAECRKKYQGRYEFNFSVYVVTGEK